MEYTLSFSFSSLSSPIEGIEHGCRMKAEMPNVVEAPARTEHPAASGKKALEHFGLQVEEGHPRHQGQRELRLVLKLVDLVHELRPKE